MAFKFLCNYALYKIKVVDKISPLIFEGLSSPDGWDALNKALIDDCNQEIELNLVHPKFASKKYERRHVLPACRGFASLTIGRYQTNNDYASVMINLASKNYPPYMVVMNYKRVFTNPDVLTCMLANALNSNMGNIEVSFEPWVPAKGEKVYWSADCMCTFDACNAASNDVVKKTFGYEQVKKKPTKRKVDDICRYIKDGYEDKVAKWIGKEIKDKNEPIDMMRPMRAFRKLKFFKKKPPMEVFTAKYRKEGMISLSSYNGYMYIKNDRYSEDDEYADTISRIKKDFGLV
jgi:hypothetical protein